MLTDEERGECIAEADKASQQMRRTPWSQHLSVAIEAKIMAKLREQKPAIYQWTLKRDGFTQYTHHPNNQAEFSGWDVKPLFEHPAPSALEGMVLVPIEPTDEMLCAGGDYFDGDSFYYAKKVWTAMLAAARSE